MKTRIKRRIAVFFAVLLLLALTAGLGTVMRQTLVDIRQSEVEHILHYYVETIMLRLQGTLNEAEALAQTARIMERGSTDWFEEAAAPLFEKDGVSYVSLIEGDRMACALPEEQYGDRVGKQLNEFSYIYTLAKVVKELVVEGPLSLESRGVSQEVFLFIQPIVENGAYLGEVAVALESSYVLEQLNLEYLSEQGYDYELWRVEAQNGGKEVIAVSDREVDFSHAAKQSFNLPAQWNLSVQPLTGWNSSEYDAGIVMLCSFAGVLMFAFAYFFYRTLSQRRVLRRQSFWDSRTGLYNRAGFTDRLRHWISDGTGPVILFYFVFERYNQISQLIGPDAEDAFLKGISGRLKEFIRSPYLAGRFGEGNFMLAVRENMDQYQMEDFSRGLSLELLLKTRLNGEKIFINARYQYALCRKDGFAEEETAALIRAYYNKRAAESPVQMLTEKCRRLIEGESDVIFDEYTDLEMMELSKTFNQYRKQVEQLAYFDPVFNVGNRPKYLRDANMLIAYDKKRQFSLFCVDICAFSQYNELFSADVGDKILREVLLRLSRQFGVYLYRINGDVFLGVTLSDEKAEEFAARLQKMLMTPVSLGNASLSLQVRIAACRYPANGDSPVSLLDHIQSALRYAKESDQKIVIYNDRLDELIRTEADIVRRLKDCIRQRTLEVWYQPLYCLESGRFTAAEALTRLPDGKGGYFPADQVISLAERNGMAEPLGNYVLGVACGFLHSAGKELGLEHMGINLSVQQLLVGNSAGHLLDLIQSTGVDGGRITLEITESILIQSISQASETLDRLRASGIRIALDDFGVGYSSLNYLSYLPVDVIKIDRSLTRRIHADPKQHAMMHAIVDMAKINSLTVVAEGVETKEEQAVISAAGIEYIQGFYYARPMPEVEFSRFFKEERDHPIHPEILV